MPSNVIIDFRSNTARLSEVILNYLSVIVDELVTGSFRYGFVNGRGGRIGLDMEVGPSFWQLTVEDSGATEGRRGSAMGKVRHVVARLGGTIDLPPVIGGHRWIVRVPQKKQDQADAGPPLRSD